MKTTQFLALLLVIFLVQSNLSAQSGPAFSQDAPPEKESLIIRSEELDEIVVVGKGVIDLARDRKTPIAVSTIKADEIRAKVGTGDITQTLVNTPSIYVAGQAGGFGDSRISVRGYEQDNTAFLLNGQPINGMEDGKMYWSNWSGLSDIVGGVQIQRGLGSSKLAISSVGGTVNFVMKTTDQKQGGFIQALVGNDSYLKTTVAYNTGRFGQNNAWGISALFTHWQGNGYIDGTKGQGQNYFLSIGYTPNKKHNFNFLITGAPQWHDQNFSKNLSFFLKNNTEEDRKTRKFNNNWGTYKGNYFTERRNYYHKPVLNLNWDFQIDDKSQLSAVLYGSFGRGGGTGSVGKRYRTTTGLVDFDRMRDSNLASPSGASTYAIRASVNNHSWFGLIANYSTELTDHLTFNVGVDGRTYFGNHFRQIIDLLDADYYEDTRHIRYPLGNNIKETYSANPWSALFNNGVAKLTERYAWDYDETINYLGIFTQLEYAKNDFSAFFQGSLSIQGHERVDRYQYTKENEKSSVVENVGFNLKGGASYSFARRSSVYFNLGYYSRQPYHDNIYLNFKNDVNPLTKNEKILGLEIGYSYTSSFLQLNINAYRTTWEDRVTTRSLITNDVLIYTTNEGVSQEHLGLEVDFIAIASTNLQLRGFFSLGDWRYKDFARVVTRDEDRTTLSITSTDVDGGEVGDAAQTSFGLGLKYKIIKNLSVDLDWRYYDRLYADVGAVKNNLKLPDYSLLDAGISFKLPILGNDKQSVIFRLNMNNIFDEFYISEARTNRAASAVATENYKGINVSNSVLIGLGTTWNFSVKFNF